MRFAYIIFFFGLNAYSSDFFLNSSLNKKVDINHYKSVRIFSGLRNTESKSSLVIDKYLNKININLITKNFDKSPASNFCHQINGEVSIVYDKNLNEFSICQFEDDSFFFTWDLIKLKLESRNE
ncbi:MAG: hypothetical protein CME61_04385 [Halobacteriovoraceae bacterium]|nr:hypothetical protein [Halobacteriovoraceae bacterium]|tara:strand:- start:643 stop:1014 length:372 start_codon:yes stop_codon:yes gene_type:complete